VTIDRNFTFCANSYNAGIFTTPAYSTKFVKIYIASVVIAAQKNRRIGFTAQSLAL
jgi:hypothetical protein